MEREDADIWPSYSNSESRTHSGLVRVKAGETRTLEFDGRSKATILFVNTKSPKHPTVFDFSIDEHSSGKRTRHSKTVHWLHRTPARLKAGPKGVFCVKPFKPFIIRSRREIVIKRLNNGRLIRFQISCSNRKIQEYPLTFINVD